MACSLWFFNTRGSTPSKDLNAITRSPFSVKETGAISKTQVWIKNHLKLSSAKNIFVLKFSSSPGPLEKPAAPVVITLYDEADQKDEVLAHLKTYLLMVKILISIFLSKGGCYCFFNWERTGSWGAKDRWKIFQLYC